MEEKCKNFSSCSAPLCPMKKKSLIGIWCPDEEACSLQMQDTPFWIKRQRKIIKGNSDTKKYFTYEMLCRTSRASKGLKGLDPDKPEAAQLSKWFEIHPLKKELTEAEKQKKRDLLNKNLNR